MATIKQKTAITKTLDNLGKGKFQPMGEIMRQSGYKESVAKNPKILTESQAWKLALASVDYTKQLAQLEEMADTKKNNDKDNALRSKKMLFDLGDKFPQRESKLFGLFKDV